MKDRGGRSGANGDLAKLQGAWDIIELAMDGRAIATAGAQIVIAGTRFTTTGMGAPYSGTIEVDAEAKPKAFTLSFTSGPEKGNASYGIYRLARDTWKICLTTRGTVRPKRFVSEPGSGIAVEILRRARNAADRPGAAPPSPPEAKAAHTGRDNELAGTWVMASAVLDGAPLDPELARYGRRVTHGDETTVYMGPQILMRMRFTIDATAKPKTIDYAMTQGAHAGKKQLGIFELSGGMLRLCVSPPGRSRPRDFNSSPGDGRNLTEWTRESPPPKRASKR
jgi:uncharacterized protein (TIGR03067 family)